MKPNRTERTVCWLFIGVLLLTATIGGLDFYMKVAHQAPLLAGL